jgi:hypothetical protein
VGQVFLQERKHNKMTDLLVPFINCLLVLDSDGDRIIAKYYSGKLKPEQLKFENALQKKTKTMTFRSDGKEFSHLISSLSSLVDVAEVLLLEQEVVVIKGSGDCKIVVSGGVDEVSYILISFSL